MRPTEQFALAYLSENGYTNLAFRPNKTPDFTSDQGGIEVKKLIAGSVVLGNGQLDSLLMANSKILVFANNKDPYPIALFESSKILERKTPVPVSVVGGRNDGIGKGYPRKSQGVEESEDEPCNEDHYAISVDDGNGRDIEICARCGLELG